MGGTLFSALFNIHVHDIIFTAVLSVIGAVISFIVSFVLKRIFNKYKNNNP
jgi:hypothetical protein